MQKSKNQGKFYTLGPLSDHFKVPSAGLAQASMSWHIFSCRTAKEEYKPDENDLFLPMNHLKDGEGT